MRNGELLVARYGGGHLFDLKFKMFYSKDLLHYGEPEISLFWLAPQQAWVYLQTKQVKHLLHLRCVV